MDLIIYLGVVALCFSFVGIAILIMAIGADE